MFLVPSLVTAGLLLGESSAFPSFLAERQADSAQNAIPPYQAPGKNDARAPCPGLNTLANHGLINRNGRAISRQSMIDGFNKGFGMAESTIDTALTNAFTVCEYVTGSNCNKMLPNLTILAEPHTFEHDHSFSRQDYNGNRTDNYNFDQSIFQSSLNVLKGSTHMNIQQANEVRLQRESLAKKFDAPGWFKQSKSTTEFELGFIFAVMTDFNLADPINNPQVRVDWWNYWFHNESFPTPLGWHKPMPPRQKAFVAKVSSSVLAAKVTSTPVPLPSGAIGPASPPAVLPNQPTGRILPLPTNPPYAAKGPVVKREAQPQAGSDSGTASSTQAPTASSNQAPSATATIAYAPPEDVDRAAAAAGENEGLVEFKNPYEDELSLDDIKKQQAYGQSMMAAVQAALATQGPASSASA